MGPEQTAMSTEAAAGTQTRSQMQNAGLAVRAESGWLSYNRGVRPVSSRAP